MLMNYEWSNTIIESQQMIFLQMCLFIITYLTNVIEDCVFSIDYAFSFITYFLLKKLHLLKLIFSIRRVGPLAG